MLPDTAANGGFPEPPREGAIRVVAADHDACGTSTRVNLPGTLPLRAVRRLHCAGCATAFDVSGVREIELRRRRLRLRLDPESLSWRLLSIPVAAVAVIALLMLLRGGDEQPASLASTPSAAAAGAKATGSEAGAHRRKAHDAGSSKPAKGTEFVQESTFSLAMPNGWRRTDPPDGATFAAAAGDAGADATLWITRDPKLDYPTFISQSLASLKGLSGSARVVERTPGPTPESTIVRIAADAPAGQPTYEATLRIAGPYRYYLATTVQPDASPRTLDAVDLITGSLTPELGG